MIFYFQFQGTKNHYKLDTGNVWISKKFHYEKKKKKIYFLSATKVNDSLLD